MNFFGNRIPDLHDDLDRAGVGMRSDSAAALRFETPGCEHGSVAARNAIANREIIKQKRRAAKLRRHPAQPCLPDIPVRGVIDPATALRDGEWTGNLAAHEPGIVDLDPAGG